LKHKPVFLPPARPGLTKYLLNLIQFILDVKKLYICNKMGFVAVAIFFDCAVKINLKISDIPLTFPNLLWYII